MLVLRGESPRSSQRSSDQRDRAPAPDWAGKFEAVSEFGEASMAQCALLIAPYALLFSVLAGNLVRRTAVAGRAIRPNKSQKLYFTIVK
jgi:hypothetical protein